MSFGVMERKVKYNSGFDMIASFTKTENNRRKRLGEIGIRSV
jgi:hypothetical protein